MKNDITMILLRFRDFGKDTIKEHGEIITKKGNVWWAWWNKPHEDPKVSELLVIQDIIEESGLNIFLVDSGKSKLYSAHCIGIDISRRNIQNSPEPEKTPEYYRDRLFNVWFNFDSIEEIAEEKLNEYSYVEVKGLFLDESDFQVFSNKRISSIRELIVQNRTLWFARLAKETDSLKEILLLKSEVTQPYHFSQKYYQARGSKLLWLSDLHLSEDVFPSDEESTLFAHLRKGTNDFNNFAGVLISGDITSYAQPDGYKKANKLLQDMNSIGKSSFNAENIVICPGNHDFKEILDDFIPEKDEQNREKMPDKITEEKNKENMKDYADFYSNIYYIYPNEYIACGKKILLPSGITIEIASLNSLLLQQYKNFEGHGYISEAQMKFVEEEMGWDKQKESSSIRIVMMHHHYMPTCLVENVSVTKASSVVYDAENLMRWMVKNNVKLLLHGHKHQSFAAQVTYPQDSQAVYIADSGHRITIVGMGGTASNTSPNQYAVIEFDERNIVIEFYDMWREKNTDDRKSKTIIIPR